MHASEHLHFYVFRLRLCAHTYTPSGLPQKRSPGEPRSEMGNDFSSGDTPARIDEQALIKKNSVCVACKLVTDNKGEFAALVPVMFQDAEESRAGAFPFAQALVAKLGKGFDATQHHLKIPGVPTGAKDVGLHPSTHNTYGGQLPPLSKDQIEQIQRCEDKFVLHIDLTDFKVLVGSPSKDEATGVVGYVGLLFTDDSLLEYNRALEVYGGKLLAGSIAHVSVCGWGFNNFATSLEARAAYGLSTTDGQAFYKANVFPSMTVAHSVLA